MKRASVDTNNCQEDAFVRMGAIEDLEKQNGELHARVLQLERGVQADQVIRSIAASSPSNIMLLDLQGQIEYISKTVPGITPEEMIGLKISEIVEDEYRSGILGALRRVAETGAPDRYETSYTSPSGDISWWESSVGPVLQESIVSGFVVVSTNVTEHRRLTEEQERFFNLSVDMMCVAGFDGYFKRLNNAFSSTLGYGDELVGKPFIEFIHPDDQEETSNIFEKMIAGEKIESFTNRVRAKDGTYRLLFWTGTIDEKRTSVYSIARDITDSKNLEEELHQSRKMEAIGKLAGGIAHDFNNLLMAIQGNIELALEAPEEVQHPLREALSASARAASLTRQLLTFSRRREAIPSVLMLDALLEDLMSLLARLLPENITVEVEHAQDTPAVLADHTQLEQLVVNLCINARDAMPHGGILRLAVERLNLDEQGASQCGAAPGQYVSLAVSDTGSGMSPEVQARIFEPFFTTKSLGHGTGLGLATVYGIVQQHQGFMNVQSRVGHGTTFRVYLPTTNRSLPPPKSLRPDVSLTGGSETILLAEDDPMVQSVVKRMLAHAGYKVLTAKDGQEALELFQRNKDRISLVMLDVVMPTLGGLETAQELRSTFPQVKLIFASGHIQHPEDEKSLQGEVQLSKPYNREELLREVRHLLDGSAQAKPSYATV